jgi:hypothetical protein
MAEFTADLYFDDILQPKEDYSDIKNNFNLTIKREESFNGGENILRELSRTTLDVKGCCYTYLCEKFKNNPCGEVKVYIEITIHGEKLTFNGLFRLSMVKWSHKKKIAKIITLKDNSFSGLVQSFMNTRIPLYNTKTQNCEDIALNIIFINTPTTPSSYVITDIFAFDVLDVFKYIVGYFTDNQVTVKSTYLTNNKFAITTGYCMHNTNLLSYQKYPELAFDELFVELYKKLNLKKVVEYELDGTPYLRIEQEDYTFEDTEILALDDTLDSESYLDIKRLYNDVQVGSTNTKLNDKSNLVYDQAPIVSWRKETIPSCGSCIGEKYNKIDLVSSYVIDTNIIHEAMITPIGDDYDYDDEIFLLNYQFNGSFNELVGNNTLKYNVNINNENVIQNFLGVTSKCLTVSRYSQDAFNINQQPYEYGGAGTNIGLAILGASFIAHGSDVIDFSNVNMDINNTIFNTPIAGTPIYHDFIFTTGVTFTRIFTYYECSKSGIYNFETDIENLRQSNSPPKLFNLEYYLYIVHYTDDNFTTIINKYMTGTVTPDSTVGVDISVITGNISVNAGECLVVYLETGYTTSTPLPPNNFEFTANNFLFYQKDSEFNCEDIQNESDKFKPYVLEFSRPLSACDYNKLKLNPKGYINIDGNKCYIEEINYSLQKTDFKLITNKLIC